MSIVSTGKFLADIAIKIRRLRKKLQVVDAFAPLEEQNEIYEALRSLEAELCSRESLFAQNEALRTSIEGILNYRGL